jgi:hypothetical protein
MDHERQTETESITFPINLYLHSIKHLDTLDLCRGDNDYRKVYIADDGNETIVIKQYSSDFIDKNRIEGWRRLMDAYRALGIYCPTMLPNLNGEWIHTYSIEKKTYYVFAETYAKYDTAEHIGQEKWQDRAGKPVYLADMMRSLGKVANARLNVVDFPSSYCLFEPFSPSDTTDEVTECAVRFADYVDKELPQFREKTQTLLSLFHKNREALANVYALLPTSCFQGDLNASNILLDKDHRFAGLIDFNLCGREPVLNYAVRESLWNAKENCLFGANGSRLYFYSQALDDRRMDLFYQNMAHIQEYYTFNAMEQWAFPFLFRYVNSFWWNHIFEIEMVKDDDEKILQIFNWLSRQMTRDDIRLP